MSNISTEFKQKTQLLEKHFHDRTPQSISEFKKVGEKEAGYSSGFQAEHEYSDSEGDKALTLPRKSRQVVKTFFS